MNKMRHKQNKIAKKLCLAHACWASHTESNKINLKKLLNIQWLRYKRQLQSWAIFVIRQPLLKWTVVMFAKTLNTNPDNLLLSIITWLSSSTQFLLLLWLWINLIKQRIWHMFWPLIPFQYRELKNWNAMVLLTKREQI